MQMDQLEAIRQQQRLRTLEQRRLEHRREIERRMRRGELTLLPRDSERNTPTNFGPDKPAA